MKARWMGINTAARRRLSAATKLLSTYRRYLPVGLTLCLGVGLSVVASVKVWHLEQERTRIELQQQADNLATALQRSIDSNLEVLLAMRDFYASSQKVERQEFKEFARGTLSRHPSLWAISWVPRVSDAQRQVYEQAIQAEGYPGFQILEITTQGMMVKALARPEYFPVTYTEPFELNQAVFGLDMFSSAARISMLEKARDTGALANSGRIELVVQVPGFIVAMPIYRHGSLHNTTQLRRQNLEGFILGVFQIADIVDASLQKLSLNNINFDLYDQTSGLDEQFLAFYESGTHKVILDPSSGEGYVKKLTAGLPCLNQIGCTRKLNVGAGQWLLRYRPTPESVSIEKHWQAGATLMGGFLLNGILVTYLLRAQRRTARIELLVQERTKAMSELSKANFEINLLNEMSDLLQSCLTVEEAYTAIAQVLPPRFPHISGGIFLINASNNLVEAVATWGTPIASQQMFTPDDCWALRRGQVHSVADTKSGLKCQHLHEPLPAESLCVPMMAQGETLGVLYLSSPEVGRLTEAKLRLAVTVAEQIGLSLANLKLREKLKNQSIRDPLTGLFNRRYMEESLEREIYRCDRSSQPLSVIMIDVDHFKRFNDTFGHEAGDIVLQKLGLFLPNHIRKSDIACRYGGEELTLILPETPIEVAQERAEQIREGIKHLQVLHRRQSLGAIAVSLGIACFPEHGSTGEAVIRAADVALYHAKTLGRDRSVTAS